MGHEKWLRLFEQLAPILKWTVGGWQKVRSFVPGGELRLRRTTPRGWRLGAHQGFHFMQPPFVHPTRACAQMSMRRDHGLPRCVHRDEESVTRYGKFNNFPYKFSTSLFTGQEAAQWNVTPMSFWKGIFKPLS
jgi:hypothetical protein